LISRWLEQRSAGVERLFPFIYHLPVDDAALRADHFGLYPVNVDTRRGPTPAVRTMSDLVGSAIPIGGGRQGAGSTPIVLGCRREVTALVDGNDPGVTWMPDTSPVVQLRLPRAIRRIEVIDLMGNRTLRRVRAGRVRVPMRGVATFLRAMPPEPLAEVQVVRSRRPGR
jgi:hypothetical protein